MSVYHFPYLPLVTNPGNNPCIQTAIRTANEIESFVHPPIANLPVKFHANPFGSFCEKLPTENNNDENITFLAEVK